ncbi:protein jag [Leptolyngbya sp. AN02str]|uniref:Jag family protein n=1 Tax=Leptolyngbya sp. AN02str TaxID=3423363 RepID=UPI003D31C22C
MTDIQDKIQRGEAWLAQLLEMSGMPPSVRVDASKMMEDGSCWLEIDHEALTSEQVSGLTGDRGEVLDAIQYLINTTLNLGKGDGEQQPYTVELNGYRVRRQEELQKIAETAAHQVLETGEEFEIRSLSSAERRQVHNLLKSYEELQTESRGQEPDRRLVVRRR